MIKKHLKAFTLIELIIVITILAILATIAFLSFQNYVKDSRDSVRLSSLKSIDNGLRAFQVNTGNYPEPENYTLIQASGTTIALQGYIGEAISKQIKINKIPLDPFDQTKYIYSSNSQKTKYQLLTHLENQNQLLYTTPTYAGDYSMRTPKVVGDNVGILLDTNNIPISGNNLDILKANSGSIYRAFFINNTITATGKNLVTTYAIANKNIAQLDSSLVGYWDMENIITSGVNTYIQDKSSYGNNCNITGRNVVLKEESLIGKGLYSKDMTGMIKCGDGNADPELRFTQFTFSLYLNRYGLSNYQWPQFLTYWHGHNVFAVRSYTYGDNIVFEYGKTNTGGLYDGTNFTSTTPAIPIKINEWNHFAFTYDGTTLIGYRNGVKYLSLNVILNPDRTQDFYLMTDNFNGLYDEARIYNRPLSDVEISHLYSIK